MIRDIDKEDHRDELMNGGCAALALALVRKYPETFKLGYLLVKDGRKRVNIPHAFAVHKASGSIWDGDCFFRGGKPRENVIYYYSQNEGVEPDMMRIVDECSEPDFILMMERAAIFTDGYDVDIEAFMEHLETVGS